MPSEAGFITARLKEDKDQTMLNHMIKKFILLCLMLSCAWIYADQNPWIGTWSGVVRFNNEEQPVAFEIEPGKENEPVLFLNLPAMKFHHLGPVPLQQTEGGGYHTRQITMNLSTDQQILTGRWALDGNDLSFELKQGALPKIKEAALPDGPIAKPVWTFQTGGAIWSSPSTTDGVVYFGSNDGFIYALQTKDGKTVWKFKTGGAVFSKPTIDGDHLYALSDDGYLYKLQRKSGKVVWRSNTNGGGVQRDLPNLQSATYDYFSSAAVVANGTVYVGSADKRLYAIDAKTGQEKWHFETAGLVRSTPAIANGIVFFGSFDHNVYAVDANTGSLKWKFDTLREVVSSPLVDAGVVYIGSRSSDLFALNAESGNVVWKCFYWSSWVESSAVKREGVLYIGSSDYQQLFAIDPASGRKIWKFNTDGSAWSTPAVTTNRVFIGSVGVPGYFIEHHGGFFAVDRAKGALVWRYPMQPVEGNPNYGVASSPVVSGGAVFFGGLDGVFYAFKI
jgi:outer membrane protein assembly factor BamB